MTSRGPEQGLVNKPLGSADFLVTFPSTEAAPILQPFTTAEKKAFRKAGHIFYPFSLQTIEAQKKAGKPFHILDIESRKFNTTPSMVGEVAFNPDPKRFFIPGSNNRTFKQQEEMVEEYGKELREKLGLTDHVRAVMGQAPDYTQLAFMHLEETGVRLFGLDYGLNFTRTKTPISTSDVAYVGSFYSALGLHIYALPRVGIRDKMFVAPLFVSVASPS